MSLAVRCVGADGIEAVLATQSSATTHPTVFATTACVVLNKVATPCLQESATQNGYDLPHRSPEESIMAVVYIGDHTFGGHRTARRRYECHQCERGISAGARYWYGVAMPDADVNSTREGRPWVLRVCVNCQPESPPPVSDTK